MSAKQKNSFWSHCEGEVGVARERRLVSEYSKHGTNEYTLSSIASSDLAVHTYIWMSLNKPTLHMCLLACLDRLLTVNFKLKLHGTNWMNRMEL